MDDCDKAGQIIAALESARAKPLSDALPILNGLAGLVQSGEEQPFEVQEVRATVFIAICELGKAIHRGQPADALWSPAIDAARRWHDLVARKR